MEGGASSPEGCGVCAGEKHKESGSNAIKCYKNVKEFQDFLDKQGFEVKNVRDDLEKLIKARAFVFRKNEYKGQNSCRNG